MPLWNEIEGEILDDNLPLQKLLRSEGRTAWFATTGADGQPAVVSVFEALNDEDTALARVQTAARVAHPNLLIIRRTGSTRIGGDPYVYAVMEPFDQTLAEVLRERPLTPDETREVTESLLSALETVEGAGLYHGHVDSAGVLGVGDSIKLRSDCLTQRHSDSSDAPALAALVYNALTGRRFSSERDALQLPAPFATLVRAGAGSNGSLAAMRRVLSGPAVTSAEAAAVPPPAAKAPIPARSSATPATAPVTARTAATAAATPRAALKQDEVGSQRRKRPGVAIAAIVLMAIALAVFWYATKRPARHAPISGEAASAPNPQQAAPAAVPPAATPTGDAAATMGAPETVKPAPKPEARTEARPAARPAPTNPATDAAPTSGERSVWHVVAYTYLYESAAQRKATELAAQYPKLEPQVFSPTGHAPFLVTLGGGTNRQEAFARRDAARTAGMPSDTYAMNFRK
jgi:eukaryotic-like serine/threonine-protein kinase